MELIQVVNKNGKYTGETVYSNEIYDKNLLHNEVAVFILNDLGQVLLEKRSSKAKFDAGKWSICTGNVVAYERLEHAALRILKEKLGINLFKESLYTYSEKEIINADSNSRITYYYYVKISMSENDFIIDKNKISEVKWFFIDDVLEMINNEDETITFDKSKKILLNGLKHV